MPAKILNWSDVLETNLRSMQNPLAFHLRCLDEEYPQKEEELCYREIDAREWFVYCKSSMSENSDNVL